MGFVMTLLLQVGVAGRVTPFAGSGPARVWCRPARRRGPVTAEWAAADINGMARTTRAGGPLKIMIATLWRGLGRSRRPVGPAVCAAVVAGLLTGCAANGPLASHDATHSGHASSDASAAADTEHGGPGEHAGGMPWAQPTASAEDAALQ